MANPFDFDDAEAAKMFEKNLIYGDDADLDEDGDSFLKMSMAAANMSRGSPDDYDGGNSLKVSSFKYDSRSRSSSGSGLSVRGTVNTTTSTSKSIQPVGAKPTSTVSKTASKPHFEREKKDSSRTETIGDVVQSSISADEFTRLQNDYKRLQNELAQAKRQLQSMDFKIPVQDTIKRIVRGEPYTLDCYKSINEKKGLLNGAVKCRDGNAIITVVLFLERTLSSKIFQRELSKCPSAVNHFIQYLRRNEEWRKLEQFYKDSLRTEDAAMLSYELAMEKKGIDERTVKLQEWLLAYGESKIIEIEELRGYIKNEINLLEKQRQIEVEDKPRELTDPIMQRFPRYKVSLKSLIKTVEYCSLYHYEKTIFKIKEERKKHEEGNHYHPEELKKLFQLTDKQYEWAVISPIAYLQRWADLEELLTSTKWFGKRADVSHIGFENVLMVLHKANANQDILIKYANLISNIDVRIKYGEKLSLHDVVIDAIVQTKDRGRMEAYRISVGDTSRKHSQKINDLLHNSSIKWR